jgi:hypothetical protein
MDAEYSAETEYSVSAMVPNIGFRPKLKVSVLVDHYLEVRNSCYESRCNRCRRIAWALPEK